MNNFNTITPMNGMSMSGGNPNDMFSMIKQMLMTSLIFKNVNNPGNSNNDYFSILYIFIVTQIIDVFMKYLPLLFNTVYSKYFVYIEETIDNASLIAEQNIKGVSLPKKKTASVIVTVNITDIENVLGQALLEHITNHKSTQHTYYTKQHFILNQQDVLCIGDDIYSCMTHNTLSKINPSDIGNDNKVPGGKSDDAVVQIIEVFSYTKDNKELRQFLNSIRKNFVIMNQNKLGTQRYFFNMHPISAPLIQGSEFMNPNNKNIPGMNTTTSKARKDLSKLPANFIFNMKPFETNRSFINLFGEEIELIKKRVKFFINNKKWYDEKGIPYTLGLLLSGAPGTGKTSTIKCLANETNRHIVNINFNNDITKTQLENLFFNENIVVNNHHTMQQEKYCIPLNQRIYVLEDVDCQGNITHDRSFTLNNPTDTDISDPHKVDLSFLLNLLDGVLETPGRIVIMTSNFPEILDKALIRPGRIDIISEFKRCTNHTIIEMLEFFYDTKLDDKQRKLILQLKERIITPAEMSKVMFENFYEVRDSIHHLIELSNGDSPSPSILEPQENTVSIVIPEDDMLTSTPLIIETHTSTNTSDKEKMMIEDNKSVKSLRNNWEEECKIFNQDPKKYMNDIIADVIKNNYKESIDLENKTGAYKSLYQNIIISKKMENANIISNKEEENNDTTKPNYVKPNYMKSSYIKHDHINGKNVIDYNGAPMYDLIQNKEMNADNSGICAFNEYNQIDNCEDLDLNTERQQEQATVFEKYMEEVQRFGISQPVDDAYEKYIKNLSSNKN